MAKIILNNVKVGRVFYEGKGVALVESYTVQGQERQQRFSAFFDKPHGLNEGETVSLEGLLGAKPETYTKKDGTQGVSANLTVNNPKLTSEVIPAQKTQEAAIMEQWPTATIGQATQVDESAPF